MILDTAFIVALSFIAFIIFFFNKAVKFINNYTEERKGEIENRIKELEEIKIALKKDLLKSKARKVEIESNFANQQKTAQNIIKEHKEFIKTSFINQEKILYRFKNESVKKIHADAYMLLISNVFDNVIEIFNKRAVNSNATGDIFDMAANKTLSSIKKDG